MSTTLFRDMLIFFGMPIVIGCVAGFLIVMIKTQKRNTQKIEKKVSKFKVIMALLGVNSDKRIGKVVKNIKVCNYVSIKQGDFK